MRTPPVSCVYVIINIVNGKKYIGSTYHMKKRWREHRAALRQNSHCNRVLQNAWNKHGEDAFLFACLEACATEQRETKEQEWIDRVKPEYNIAQIVGKNFALGVPKTDEHKKKISVALTGKPKSPTAIARMAKSLTGRKCAPRSAETCRKLSEANKGQVPWAKGKKFTAEHRAKISESRKRQIPPTLGIKKGPRTAEEKLAISLGVKRANAAKAALRAML